jgi:hypothetical protein
MQDCYTYVDTKVKSGKPRSKGGVFGVGINDVDGVVYQKNSEGVYEVDPFYYKWKKMLERVYYKKCHDLQPNYLGLSLHEPWLKFSVFKGWMLEQVWEGRELDKDLLGDGTLYSPETCCFVYDKTNNFLKTPKMKGRDPSLPIGVITTFGTYKATISDFTVGKTLHLGTFDNPMDAHLAWLNKKRELAYLLADMEHDPRVKRALRSRYEEPLWDGS